MTDPSSNGSVGQRVRQARPVWRAAMDRCWTAENLLSLGVLLGFGIYFASLIYRYRDMFLLIEYRQWVFHAPQHALVGFPPFSHLFDPNVDPSRFQIAFSRSTSLWLADLFGDVCGPTPACHNRLHALMLILSTIFIAMSVRASCISRSWFPAVTAGVTVALSVPMVDAITWQATLLDKTAMLLTSLTILIASHVGINDPRSRRAVLANLLLFVPTFLAYNAKEAALFLAPATILLLFFRAMIAGASPVRAVRQTMTVAALPFAYACLHVAMVFYNRTYLQPGEMSRVTGGNLAFNAEFYARYILDMLGGDWTIADLKIAGAGLLFFVSAAILIDVAGVGRRHVPLSLFALLALAGSLTIPLRTSSTSPFYLLVSLVYFGLVVGLSVDSVLARLPGAPLRIVFAGCCTAVLAMRVVSLGSALPEFDHLETLSTNFQRTLDRVRTVAAQTPYSRILFVRPAEEQRAYMYASSPGNAGDYALAPYLSPPGATVAELVDLDAKIRDVSSAEAATAIRPRDLVVTLRPDLSLDRVVLDR